MKSSRLMAGFETLGQLGARTGLNPSTLWRIEKGLTMPKPETLKKLSPAIRVPMNELMVKAGYVASDEFKGEEREVPYGKDVLNLSELSPTDREKVRSYFEFVKFSSKKR